MATNERAMTCPYCGGPVPLDTPVCPGCREDLSALVRLRYRHVIHYNQALALAREGDLDQARDRLLVALAQRPGFAEAHALLAKVYSRKGEWSEARASIERLLELSPDDGGARELAERISQAEMCSQEALVRASRQRAERMLTVYLRDVARAFGLGVAITTLVVLIIHWIGAGRGNSD